MTVHRQFLHKLVYCTFDQNAVEKSSRLRQKNASLCRHISSARRSQVIVQAPGWVARQERSDGRGLPVLLFASCGPKRQRGEVIERVGLGWHRRRQTSVCRRHRIEPVGINLHRTDESCASHPDIVPMSGPPRIGACSFWVARQERSDGRGLSVLPFASYGPKRQRGEAIERFFCLSIANFNHALHSLRSFRVVPPARGLAHPRVAAGMRSPRLALSISHC